MRLKILPLLLIVLTLVNCKKEKKPDTVNANIVGKWTLYQFQTNAFAAINVTAGQYPCLKSNIITFNADNTEVYNYTGTDTCFVLPTHTLYNSVYVGYPTEPSNTSTWSSNGNNVYLYRQQKTYYGVLSSKNGQYHLIFADTLITGTDTAITIQDNIKE